MTHLSPNTRKTPQQDTHPQPAPTPLYPTKAVIPAPREPRELPSTIPTQAAHPDKQPANPRRMPSEDLPDSVDAHIEHLVAQAPPLTNTQRTHLRAILSTHKQTHTK
jgi:hypothetical protein